MVKQETLKFPKGFLWGAASAAHQAEGGNIHNDWYQFEKQGGCEDNQVSGETVDHYHRYEEDFDLAQKLHHNTHRFSIEWSRIEPNEGEFDVEALAHYQNVIKALQKRNMKVMVTLFHFLLPSWFAQKGGFTKRKTSIISNGL